MERVMTRWNLLHDITVVRKNREAIGKAWPLFLFLILNTGRSNKFVTTYTELKEKMNENTNTLKHWKEQLVKNKVVQVVRGRSSMTVTFLSPYDSLITCEQDDWATVRIKTDPKVKRALP